jgi:hypothetical protein
LAQVGDKTVIAPLVAIARTGHPAAVEKMLKSIKSWEPIEQRRATEKIVAAANTDLRVSAIRALASLRDQGIFDPTAFLSGGPNPSGEKVVSDALSKLK